MGLPTGKRVSLLALLVLAGCATQPGPQKKDGPTVDVAQTVKQKMPASVKDRDGWAKEIARKEE